MLPGLTLALTGGKQVQDAMGIVLLLGIRVAQHPEEALHLSRDMCSPYGVESPGKPYICTILFQALSLLTDSLFSCLSPSNS